MLIAYSCLGLSRLSLSFILPAVITVVVTVIIKRFIVIINRVTVIVSPVTIIVGHHCYN